MSPTMDHAPEDEQAADPRITRALEDAEMYGDPPGPGEDEAPTPPADGMAGQIGEWLTQLAAETRDGVVAALSGRDDVESAYLRGAVGGALLIGLGVVLSVLVMVAARR